MRNAGRLAMWGLAFTAVASAGDQSASTTGQRDATSGWRSARWGMTVEEVLKAFPGEAKHLDPEVKLEDGNVVAAEIHDYAVASHAFRVRFVFEGGKLAIVSLRTPEDKYAGPEVFKEIENLLMGELGRPVSSGADDSFIDMRQTRWEAGRSQVDLKYIPGVVVIQYHPPSLNADGGRSPRDVGK